MEDTSKLPKWAQNKIARLQSDADYWRVKAHAAAGTDGSTTDTYIQELQDNRFVERGLPPGTPVIFRLEGGSAEGEVRVKDGALQVYFPKGRPVLRFGTSNTFTIYGESLR